MNLSKICRIGLSIPKTIYFNFKTLKFSNALKLPFFISYDTKLGKLRKNIEFDEKVSIRPFMIKFGIGGSQGIMSNYGFFSCGKKGKIIFSGRASFGAGCSVRVDSGVLSVGNNFSANKNCFISCSDAITFGDDVLLGFNIAIRDSDGHTIYSDGVKKSNILPVIIGNHVWICSEVDVLKGCEIADNCVISYRSCVFGKFEKDNCLIGGYPAKIISENIDWEK